MSVAKLLLSSEGRIGRRTWLLFVVAVLTLYFAALGAAMVVNGLDLALDRDIYWLGPGFMIVASYPAFCVNAKRFQDRGKGRWWALAATVTDLAVVVVDVLFLLRGDVGPILEWSVNAPAYAVMVWFFVELGCLRGTPGENRYGSDPLAGS